MFIFGIGYYTKTGLTVNITQKSGLPGIGEAAFLKNAI
jgi:hypothetical protein